MGTHVCNLQDVSLKGRGAPLSTPMVMEVGMTEQQDTGAWISEPKKQNHQVGIGLPTQELICHRERSFKPLCLALITHS